MECGGQRRIRQSELGIPTGEEDLDIAEDLAGLSGCLLHDITPDRGEVAARDGVVESAGLGARLRLALESTVALPVVSLGLVSGMLLRCGVVLLTRS